MIAFQDPPSPEPTEGLVAQLQALGWIDHTAIAVLLVFFVIGLFKGLIWQVSRIGILVAAYLVAGRFGHDVADLLSSTPADQIAAEAVASTALAPGEATLYLAYVLLFLAVLIVLSLAAMLLKKLADKAGLSFFDRLGGGVLGVATGACVVLALVFGINMFFPESNLARAAESSHALRFSQEAIKMLGASVNDDLRSVLRLQPLSGDQSGDSRSGQPGAQPGTLPGIGDQAPRIGEPRPGTPQPGVPRPGAPQPGTPRPNAPQPGTPQPGPQPSGGNGNRRRGD